MARNNRSLKELMAENEDLRARLNEAEDILGAIGRGEVDALVVSTPEGDQVFTLKGAEHPYRVLVESMNEGAATLAPDGTVLYCNHHLATMLQVRLETLIGSNLKAFVSPPDVEAFQSMLQRCSELSNKRDISFRTAPGETVPVLVSCSSLSQWGSPGISLVMTDLSEHRKAEEVMVAERLARSILEQAGEAILVCDEGGKIIRHSRQVEHITNRAPYLQRFDDFLPLHVDGSGEPFRITGPLQGKVVQNLEVTYGGNSDVPRHLLLNATPLRNAEGSIVGCILTLTDISDRKKYEQELVEARRAAEAASHAKSQFLANMSHELRTPMHGILGVHQLLMEGYEGSLEQKQKELLMKANKSAQFLLRIISDILDLSRIEVGALTIEEKPISVRQCVWDTIEFLTLDAEQKNLELNYSIADSIPEVVRGDCIRLRQVLFNLVGNAIKFTEQGKIQVAVSSGKKNSTGEREITFTVNDTGIGVPEEKKHLLFRPFTQVDASDTRKYGGTGLGLSISKKIIDLMGGTISFESEEGKGTSFRFTVPMKEREEPMATMEVHPPETSHSVWGKEQAPRILIAEDDPLAAELVKEILMFQGLKADLAPTGRDAVDMWERGEYDLIIMDIQMPRMDGLTATRIIREHEKDTGKRIPIVAMTAHAFPEDEERCFAAGMDAYLTKPLDIHAGIDMIRRLLSK